LDLAKPNQEKETDIDLFGLELVMQDLVFLFYQPATVSACPYNRVHIIVGVA